MQTTAVEAALDTVGVGTWKFVWEENWKTLNLLLKQICVESKIIISEYNIFSLFSLRCNYIHSTCTIDQRWSRCWGRWRPSSTIYIHIHSTVLHYMFWPHTAILRQWCFARPLHCTRLSWFYKSFSFLKCYLKSRTFSSKLFMPNIKGKR
jgi:hypothetical protein